MLEKNFFQKLLTQNKKVTIENPNLLNLADLKELISSNFVDEDEVNKLVEKIKNGEIQNDEINIEIVSMLVSRIRALEGSVNDPDIDSSIKQELQNLIKSISDHPKAKLELVKEKKLKEFILQFYSYIGRFEHSIHDDFKELLALGVSKEKIIKSLEPIAIQDFTNIFYNDLATNKDLIDDDIKFMVKFGISKEKILLSIEPEALRYFKDIFSEEIDDKLEIWKDDFDFLIKIGIKKEKLIQIASQEPMGIVFLSEYKIKTI
jgi:hypothetical protein